MNSELAERAAAELADRVTADARSDADAADRLWWAALGRPADERERSTTLAFLRRYRAGLRQEADADSRDAWRALAQALLASNDFVYLP